MVTFLHLFQTHKQYDIECVTAKKKKKIERKRVINPRVSSNDQSLFFSSERETFQSLYNSFFSIIIYITFNTTYLLTAYSNSADVS